MTPTYYMCPAALLAAITVASIGAIAEPITLPPVHVDGTTPSCVDVQVQDARSLSFDCLNQNLKDAAQDHGATPPAVTARPLAELAAASRSSATAAAERT